LENCNSFFKKEIFIFQEFAKKRLTAGVDWWYNPVVYSLLGNRQNARNFPLHRG
jgi:hypothetical protein